MDINITKPAGVVLKTAQKYCSEDISVIPVLEDITVTPTTTEQAITPTTGKAGISKVTIEAVTNTIDSNITAENIKKDVTILGVTGTLEQGGAEAVLGTLNVTSNGIYKASNTLSLEPGGLYEYKKVLPREVLAELKTKTSNTDLLFCVPSLDLPLVAIFVKEIDGEYVLEQINAEAAISIYATASTTVPINSKNIAVNAGWNFYFAGNDAALSIETALIRLPQDLTNIDASFINLLNKQFDTSNEIAMSIDTSSAVTITDLGTYYKVTSFPADITKKNLAIVSLLGYNEFSDFSASPETAEQAMGSLVLLRAIVDSSALQTDIAGLKYIKCSVPQIFGNTLVYVEDASQVQVSSGVVETGCWYATLGTGDVAALNGSTWVQEKDLLDGYNKVIVAIPTQEKAIEITTNGTTEITPDAKNMLSKVTVTTDVQPVLQEKTIEVTQNGTTEITPDSGKVLSKVTIATDVQQPVLQEKTVSIDQNGTIEVIPDGEKVLSKVTITTDVQPVLQEKTIGIVQNGTTEIIPDSGKALSKVTVVTSVSDIEQKTGDYTVKVIDYDGTILLETKGNTGDTVVLPVAPIHNKLIFQEWSASVVITNNTITIEDNDVIIGAVYKPTSGKSEFDIVLTKFTGLNVTLNMDGTKDWGDGTSDTETTHAYAEYGDYTIMCDGITMNTARDYGLFGQRDLTINYYCVRARLANVTKITGYAFQYCYSLANITIPNSVTSIGGYAFNVCCSLTNIIMPSDITAINFYTFSNCYSLTDIIIPNSVVSIGAQAFQNCYSLKNIIIPNNVTSIGTNAFQKCYALTDIIIPNNVASIGVQAFQNCYSLIDIILPSSVTSIDRYSFGSCFSVTKYDFSQHISIPTLSSTNAFSDINKICKIIVPDDLAAEWVAATNWSTYADYIYKVSEINGGGDNGNAVTDANGNILQDSNGNNIEFTEA